MGNWVGWLDKDMDKEGHSNKLILHIRFTWPPPWFIGKLCIQVHIRDILALVLANLRQV